MQSDPFPQFSLEGIIRAYASADFSFLKMESYLLSYGAFIRYFNEKHGTLNEDDLIIGIHMVYGWMPTIFEFKHSRLGEAVDIINAVKLRRPIGAEELGVLKALLNNSIVGTSKLLHFINPEDYAIWDSRVYRFLSGKVNVDHVRVNQVSLYLLYLQRLRTLAAEPEFLSLVFAPLMERLGVSVTPLRALELVLYVAGGPVREGSI